MDVVIRRLRSKDFNLARKFAIDGMHQHWYTGNDLELYLYSKYFWCLEMSRATRALGAYMGNALVGVLLVDMNNEPKVYNSTWYKAYVKLATFVINVGYKGASGSYENANKKLLNDYHEKNKPDGELNFFAVDPDIKGKGIGTLMLRRLEKLEKGKLIYLFSDSGATYQFYPSRGFEEVGKQDITLKIHGEDVPLTCMLFSKRL